MQPQPQTPSIGRLQDEAEVARKNRYDDPVGYIRAALALLDATEGDDHLRVHRAYAEQLLTEAINEDSARGLRALIDLVDAAELLK